MTPKSTLLRYLLLPAICIQTVSAFCYSPDGRTLTARPDIVPCNIIQGSTSMCCKTNVTKAADADVCMPNGLCRESSTQPHYWRNDCSDPTFPSAHCIKACSSNATVSIFFFSSMVSGSVLCDLFWSGPRLGKQGISRRSKRQFGLWP
jgi:hypothetical protein